MYPALLHPLCLTLQGADHYMSCMGICAPNTTLAPGNGHALLKAGKFKRKAPMEAQPNLWYLQCPL